MSALGGLLGGGGGAPPPGGGGGSPEDLLNQIMDLMTQYLSMGPDTPAYQTISEALPAIQESMGGGGDVEDAADVASEPGGEPPPDQDQGGSPMDTMMPSSPPTSFGDASAQAMDAFKKKKVKGY